MIFILYLLFFLLGAISAAYLRPILETLVELLITFLEERKGRIAIRIAKLQEQISGCQCEERAPAVGFAWCDDEEEDEEESEPEDE